MKAWVALSQENNLLDTWPSSHSFNSHLGNMLRESNIFTIYDEWIEKPAIQSLFMCEQCHGFIELYFLGSVLYAPIFYAFIFLVTAL